jgi:hypothetical protein
VTRCPSCDERHEDDPLVCDRCGAELGPTEVPSDARLGLFHPLVADRVVELLFRRGVRYGVVERDDEVEVRVDAAWRDDLRTELSLDWGEVVRHLDADEAPAVFADGGSAPGWFDAPRGGHIDRAGRLVVSSDGDDEARIVGPALLTVGSILAIVGWYVLGSGAVLVAGIGLALVGLFTPR